jgi:uncharacterized membrane protein
MGIAPQTEPSYPGTCMIHRITQRLITVESMTTPNPKPTHFHRDLLPKKTTIRNFITVLERVANNTAVIAVNAPVLGVPLAMDRVMASMSRSAEEHTGSVETVCALVRGGKIHEP